MKIHSYFFYITAAVICIGLLWFINVRYHQPQTPKLLLEQAIKASLENKYDYALTLLDKALEIAPEDHPALMLKATLLVTTKKPYQAIEVYETLRSLEPKNTDILSRLANLYQEKGQLFKSAKLYGEVIKLNKATPSTYSNFAWALSHIGLYKEAIPFYLNVISAVPDNPRAHSELAEIYLTCGDFKQGWKEFEWRQPSPRDTRDFKTKQWSGTSSISGKKILLRSEYGLGDAIQFIRYAKKLKELNARVYVEAHPPLIPLLSMVSCIDKVIPLCDPLVCRPLPSFDFQIRLMSLAQVFSPDEKSILHSTPYLHADPQLTTYWKANLKNDSHFKIGIAWQGNKRYDDSLPPFSKRTVDPKLLLPLLNHGNMSFYSLHTDDINKTLPEKLNIKIFDEKFDQAHGSFMDTAAVMMNLDLIITVDTSIAHLAGALGRPVWVLLPYIADWRWQLNRTDSPWYPTMHLFRQEKPGDWSIVINNICKELEELQHTRTT